MKTLRVHLSALTASFRYPGFVVGFQPTLPTPPLSTIYGLVSAAKGQIIIPDDVAVGYVFLSKGKGVDLETIYELKGARRGKSNVIKRGFFSDVDLYLYLNDESYGRYFKKPYYPLVLGRSSDLAKVNSIKRAELDKRKGVRLGKTILPFGVEGAHGTFYSLPTYFTDTIPREARDVKPFILMDKFFDYEDKCYFDPEKEWGVWMHGRGFNSGEK